MCLLPCLPVHPYLCTYLYDPSVFSLLIYPRSKQSCIFEMFIKISSKAPHFHIISFPLLGGSLKKSFEALSWKTELTHFSKFMISCNATDLEPSECSYCSRLQITTNRKYKGKGRAQAEKESGTIVVALPSDFLQPHQMSHFPVY